MGLTFTKHFINMLGGNIIIESEVNKGSEISFEIPKK